MMTPTQLREHEFKASGRNAYKADDVDAFIAELSVDYEKMFRENGELITLKLDTTLPRLYDREITVSGTKGYYNQTLRAVVLDGDRFNHEKNVIQDSLNSQDDYSEYLPEDWKTITEEQLKTGHGGMDFIMEKHFFRAVSNKEDMPIDVYEACAMMCVTALSEESIRSGGAPVSVPDFTRGEYKNRKIRDVMPLPTIKG